MEFGKRLKYFRKAKGFSIYKLSKESGISQNHISAIENEKRQPTIDTLVRLIKPLGITLSELFSEGEISYLTEQERDLITIFRSLSNEKSLILYKLSKLLNE